MQNSRRSRRRSRATSEWTQRICHRVLKFHSFHRVFIGIKKLLDLIDMAKCSEPQHRVIKFLTKLEDEGGLDNGSSVRQ